MEAEQMDLREQTLALVWMLKATASGLYRTSENLLLKEVPPKHRREIANLLRVAASNLDKHALLDDPDGEEMPEGPVVLDSGAGRYRPAERGWEIDIPSAGPEMPMRPQDSPVQDGTGDPVE